MCSWVVASDLRACLPDSVTASVHGFSHNSRPSQPPTSTLLLAGNSMFMYGKMKILFSRWEDSVRKKGSFTIVGYMYCSGLYPQRAPMREFFTFSRRVSDISYQQSAVSSRPGLSLRVWLLYYVPCVTSASSSSLQQAGSPLPLH